MAGRNFFLEMFVSYMTCFNILSFTYMPFVNLEKIVFGEEIPVSCKREMLAPHSSPPLKRSRDNVSSSIHCWFCIRFDSPSMKT